MARTLTSNVITEKNKPESTHPRVVLIDLPYDASNYLYMTDLADTHTYYKIYNASYTGDWSLLNFNSTNYHYYDFTLGSFSEDSTGKIASMTLTIQDADRAFAYYVHNYTLIGQAVDIRLLFANHMIVADQIFDTFFVTGISAVKSKIKIKLGHFSYIKKEFGVSITKLCNYVFKGAGCGYSGAGTDCTKNLGESADVPADKTCYGYGNEANFGGFPFVRTHV